MSRCILIYGLSMPALLQHRLLIVDDDPSIHELLQAMLVDTPWEADSASSGEAALTQMEGRGETHAYDVVLADILMPGMDGLTLLGRLRVRRLYRQAIFTCSWLWFRAHHRNWQRARRCRSRH